MGYILLMNMSETSSTGFSHTRADSVICNLMFLI